MLPIVPSPDIKEGEEEWGEDDGDGEAAEVWVKSLAPWKISLKIESERRFARLVTFPLVTR